MPDKYVGSVPYVVGKPWDRAAIELHEFLRKLNFAHNLQVDLNAASISGGNTSGSLTPISSGTIYFSASNNLTLNQSGNSLGIIGPSLISVGVSTGGNTAGTTGLVASQLVLYGGSNVSLSQSVSGQSATITWNVHPPIGIAAGTQTATTGTIQFANSNGVTFGMSGSNTITASVAAGGGVAISAGTESASSGTVVFSNSNNVSFGMNAGTITATATVVSTAASITASGSNGSFYSNFINFDLSNTNITVYTTENGFGSAALAFSARQKYLEAGMSTQGNTAGTPGLVYQDLVFVGSNNITLSQSADGTNATLSIIGAAGGAGDGYNIIAAGTQTAGTTGTVKFADSNGITFGMSNSTQVTADFGWYLSAGTTENASAKSLRFIDSNGISFGLSPLSRITASVRTDYASSDHSHGNPTLALTNLTGTTASASNGLTISLSAAAPGGGGGSQSIGMSTQTAGGGTAGTTGYAQGSAIQYLLVPGSNITMSQSVNGSSGTLSIYAPAGGGTPPATVSYYQFPAGAIQLSNTTSVGIGGSSVFVEPFVLPVYVSASYIRVPILVLFGSSAIATTANISLTLQQTVTDFIHIYSQGVGASSQSIQSIYSTSNTGVLQVRYQVGAASNNQTCSHAITYGVTGSAAANFATNYSPAASSNMRISTTHLTSFNSYRFLDIPLATLLSPGNYWIGIQKSSATATTGGVAGMTNVTSSYAMVAMSQNNFSIRQMGGHTSISSNAWMGYGHGFWSTNSLGRTTASMGLASVSSINNHPVVQFQFIRRA